MAAGKQDTPIDREMKEYFGFSPTFFEALPEGARANEWAVMRDFQLAETALPGKVKELIGLAVAAHIKCGYCIHFHTQAARIHGATDEELREACYMGGLTVQMSNALTGMRVDMTQFKGEVDRAMQFIKQQAQQPAHKH